VGSLEKQISPYADVPSILYARSFVPSFCVLWGMLSAAGLGLLLVAQGAEVMLLGGCLTLYGALSFIAELAGVSLGPERVAFPARLFQDATPLSLWRTSRKIDKIHQLYSVRGEGAQKIVLVCDNQVRRALYFPNRAAKHNFLMSAKTLNSQIEILRQ
jgi:hypothetical protein